MNYSQLFETIKGYVENDFPSTSFTDSAGSGTATLTSTEQVNTFIEEAERRIYNSVQILALRKNMVGNTTASNPYLTVPSDWLANFSLAVIDPTSGEYSYLLNKDVNYIRQAFPSPTATGKPSHYAMFDDDSYILGPTPNLDYDVELHYFYYPPSIVTSGTSWLGDNFDPALLYGSLLEAYTFMKGEQDMMALYAQQYQMALAGMKQFGESKEVTDDYRTGMLIRPKQ